RPNNAKIQACFIRSKHDCIDINAAWDYPAENGVEKVRVSRSVFWNGLWGNGLEVGFELRANKVHDIVFEDCDIIHVERGAVFSIHNGDYAVVDGVRYENIRVEDARHKLFDFAIFLSRYSIDSPKDPEEVNRRYLHGAWDGVLSVPNGQQEKYATNRGHIKNIQVKNISVLNGPFPFSIIHGYDKNHLV
ncbi:MAG: glycosyl hydrolase family 28 protein, partial [Candidatus Bathyarchaeia archaeon]